MFTASFSYHDIMMQLDTVRFPKPFAICPIGSNLALANRFSEIRQKYEYKGENCNYRERVKKLPVGNIDSMMLNFLSQLTRDE